MLFMIQTLWQFPHFYGLAWRYRQDYLRGGFISFPLSDTTGHLTAKMMKPYIIGAALLPFVSLFIIVYASSSDHNMSRDHDGHVPY